MGCVYDPGQDTGGKMYTEATWMKTQRGGAGAGD